MKTLLVSLVFVFLATQASAGTVRGRVTLLDQKAGGEWGPAASNAGAVVYVTGFDEPPSKKTKIYLNQKDRAFLPRVLAVNTGDTVTFRNMDDVYHNVWSLSKPMPFDLGSFKAPEEKTVTFMKPGLVRIFCNIHPQMIASLLVLKNNRYAVTDEKGAYTISNVPAGNHELRVWSEGAEPTVKSVKVTASSKTEENFTVKHVPQSENHPNKFGKPYAGTQNYQ